MARALTTAELRSWADKLDGDEREERIAKLEAEITELREQRSQAGLSDEERAELTELREKVAALEAAGADDDDQDDDDQDDDQDDDDDGKRKRKRYRPGRKSGAAYDWTVDENGDVVDLEVATVWTGGDEPDRVELPEPKTDDDGEGEAE